jgi:beta-lactam-binding protein with PASTA domain
MAVASIVFVGAVGTAETQPRHSVIVPHVLNEYVATAYGRLHRAGLRVSIPAGVAIGSVAQDAIRMNPGPGRRVLVGTTVTLSLGCRCGGGALVAPVNQPSYQVPNFVGRRANVAVAWIHGKTLAFGGHLGPLHAAAAKRFFENYIVKRQSPAPGSQLRFSAPWPSNPGISMITPLSIWGSQTR